jgi:hypothetical protein
MPEGIGTGGCEESEIHGSSEPNLFTAEDAKDAKGAREIWILTPFAIFAPFAVCS